MPPITPNMKVADVIDQQPETADVFLSYGCPDMRGGFFRMMSRIMTVRRAAFIHRIPLDELLRDLNAVETPRGEARTASLPDK